MFTARYALSPYMPQIRLVFTGLKLVYLMLSLVFGTIMADAVRQDAQSQRLKLYTLIQLRVNLQLAEGLIRHIQAEFVVFPFVLNFKWTSRCSYQC